MKAADTVLTYAANLGFPALIAVYLLTRIEEKLQYLTSLVERLYDAGEKGRDTASEPHPE